jgi:hypothetical protein
MDGTKSTTTIAGVTVPAEERTPLVEHLLRVIEELRAENSNLHEEINRLKGLPQRPAIRPSTLNGADSDSPRKKKKKRRGKRPGSAKRRKTEELTIHETVALPLEGLLEGTRQNGHEDYVVQDLVLKAHNTCYQRLRYLLPDGSERVAPLPAEVQGHFGPTLRSYVLYQHHQNHVTQPLIREELLELGIDISSGQVNRLLTEGLDAFHQEKDALLPAARACSPYLHTDDTGARHQGKNGYTNVIGSPLFASFTTTDSKSRVNFLTILCAPYKEYRVTEEALEYMENQGLSHKALARLATAIRRGPRVLTGGQAWQRQLRQWGIQDEKGQRIATEGALVGTLMHYELYLNQPLLSDDAGQFEVAGFLHALCWLHAERPLRKLLTFSPREQETLQQVREDIWKYYQRLRVYREAPTEQERVRLERDYKTLFTRRTGFAELNELLRRIYDKREELLLVLEHPAVPLHNNDSERDIREWAKKRKISAGTRSDLGQRCRDTFISLKKTCRKLGVSFWQFLQDRILGKNEVLPLPDLIRQTARDRGFSPI